jgi:translocation and assembly module TamB
LSPTSWLALTPDINITLDNQTVKLAGQIDIVDGLIKVKQLPQGAVKVSDDEIIVNTHMPKSKSLPISYDIDLAVLIANKVTIDSFGLKSGLEGDLLFKQQQNRPLIATGTLILPDGKYRVFGQELLIQNGELNFNGAIDKPYLNVKAVRNPDLTSNGVIVGVTLSGVIDNPILKVFSEPSMDEMMALHYLLTGRSINDSNSASETMLTQFLLDQSLARGGGNVSQIVEAFGFNDVSLSSRGSGDDTKVEISGYVSPDIQVSYRIGIFNSLSEVAVRYHFLPKLYIEAISGLNNSLDMLYKFEFE